MPVTFNAVLALLEDQQKPGAVLQHECVLWPRLQGPSETAHHAWWDPDEGHTNNNSTPTEVHGLACDHQASTCVTGVRGHTLPHDSGAGVAAAVRRPNHMKRLWHNSTGCFRQTATLHCGPPSHHHHRPPQYGPLRNGGLRPRQPVNLHSVDALCMTAHQCSDAT